MRDLNRLSVELAKWVAANQSNQQHHENKHWSAVAPHRLALALGGASSSTTPPGPEARKKKKKESSTLGASTREEGLNSISPAVAKRCNLGQARSSMQDSAKRQHHSVNPQLQGRSTLPADLPSKAVCPLQDRMAVQNSAGLWIELQPCVVVPSATVLLAIPICSERFVHHAEAGPGCPALRLGLYEVVTVLLTRPRLDKHVIALFVALFAYLPSKTVCPLQDRMAVQNSAGLRIELQPCIMVPRATIPLAIPTCSERSAHHPELGPGCLALRLGGYELVAIIVARAKLDEYVQGRTGSAA